MGALLRHPVLTLLVLAAANAPLAAQAVRLETAQVEEGARLSDGWRCAMAAGEHPAPPADDTTFVVVRYRGAA